MTTPTPTPIPPAAIEAAEDAYREIANGTCHPTLRDVLTAALSAAAPLIAAQAKPEALAEVAEWEAEAAASVKCAANLRSFEGPNARKRLDQQEADRYEHHATIARNLAARMRETLTATLEGEN